MPKLIFVNRFFFPDHSATSQILSDLAFDLVRTGREVHVVTSTQIYDDAKAALPDRETVNGVNVHRVASTQFGRSALPGRAVDYVSFYRSVHRRLSEITRPGDIIVAKTDPPLLGAVAMAAAQRRGARLINWLQDIYPEIAVVLDVPFMRGPVAAALSALRNRTLRQAQTTVVVGDLMRRRVETLGADPARVRLIANWCDDESIKPLSPADNPLRKAWDLADKFAFGYSGNLGRAHEYDTVLAAAERLRDAERIVFLIIGGGTRFDELARAVKTRGLDSAFRFMPYQDQAMLPHSLAVPDLHWVSLNPRLEGLIVPSKFYGIAAAGKPMIVIGDRDGELARLVTKHDCGIVIVPGNAGALIETLQRLSADPYLVSEMGRKARQMLDAYFTRQQGLARWHTLLDQVDQSAESVG